MGLGTEVDATPGPALQLVVWLLGLFSLIFFFRKGIVGILRAPAVTAVQGQGMY